MVQDSEQLFHTDDTMHKVFSALRSVGLSDQVILDAVNAMQNNGIYFREIKPTEK